VGTRFRTANREEKGVGIPAARSSPAKRSAKASAPGVGRRPGADLVEGHGCKV
jgi:hypothetical protein